MTVKKKKKDGYTKGHVNRFTQLKFVQLVGQTDEGVNNNHDHGFESQGAHISTEMYVNIVWHFE